MAARVSQATARALKSGLPANRLVLKTIPSTSCIVGCQNTLNRAMIAMDEGHGAAFAACFTKDAQCDVSLTGASAVGTDELANLAVAIKQRFHPARHWEGNVTINQDGVNGETATNVSYWKALNGEETISTGIHLDTLRNENGEWLIEKREIKHTWTKECGHIET